jgi:pimeloyl-ACP methyl ester carboxylesterase
MMIVTAGLLVGCVDRQVYLTPDRLHRGLVVVLPGIEGRSRLNEAITVGLVEGGVNWAIEIDDWTGTGLLINLYTEQRNRKIASQLAGRIERYRRKYPGRPVVLIGHSGGGAIAVWAAEALPADQTVDGLILINASLSPGYDLRGALMRTRRGIVNFYSSGDWLLLGLGTTFTGTMDREHGASAGMVGFNVPDTAPGEYRRLYQIGWSAQMARTGHTGGHFASSASRFAARYIAPLVLAENWSASLIDTLQHRSLYKTTDSPVESPRPAPGSGPRSVH